MRKTFTPILLPLIIAIALPFLSSGQGCVAVRPMGCGGANPSTNSAFMSKGDWQATVLYRYFQSYKHFKGDSEQHERVEQGTQVINDAHSIDLSLSHALSNRLSVSVNLPLIYYDRSSLYEHYGNSKTTNPNQLRFHTGAKGIGDLRVSGSYWLLKPEKHLNGNVAVGLGIKAPTGNYNVQDDFHRLGSDGQDSTYRRAVDQSIQLGDGGWGFTVEAQAFKTVFHGGAVYVAGFYMFNPRNVNTTLNRGTLVGVDPLIAYHSVADQFAARFGMNYALPVEGLSFSLGARAEGVPAHDVIGKEEGFRRPGYIISGEPGLLYVRGNTNFAVNVPIALYRNRVKSFYDLADPKGLRHGDAAFADYLINVSVSHRFSKKTSMSHAPVFKEVDAKK